MPEPGTLASTVKKPRDFWNWTAGTIGIRDDPMTSRQQMGANHMASIWLALMGRGRFYRLAVWYDLEGCDDEVAGTARNVAKRIRVSFVALGLVFQRWLVAIAVFAQNFFLRHTL
jgi:hypothetical protein